MLQSDGKLVEAISAYSHAIALDPSFALAYTNRGCCRLLLGDYSAGWADYQWRLRTPQVQTDQYPQPLWDGRPLAEGTLLIHGEQGVGDEIQFASCLPDVVPLAKRCVLVCHPRLAKLMARSFPAVAVVGHERKSDHIPPQFRIAIDAQSHPATCRSTRPVERCVSPSAAILIGRSRAEAQLAQPFRGAWTWAESRHLLVRRRHLEERRHRTTALTQWRDLFAIPGVQFVNLQYGDCAEELAAAAKTFGRPIYHFDDADPLGDLDDFAAKVAALDLVISIGNATVHLAAALGVPTWALGSFLPQWRWGVAGERTPWYPSVRIIRQTRQCNWLTTLSGVASQLRANSLRKGPTVQFT